MNPDFSSRSSNPADDYLRMRMSSIRESDFDLAEKVIMALFTSVPGDHPVRQDADVAEFVDAISNAGNFLKLLPATFINDGQVTHRSASPDLPEAQVDMTNQMTPLLAKIHLIAGRLEEAGFPVYSLDIRL